MRNKVHRSFLWLQNTQQENGEEAKSHESFCLLIKSFPPKKVPADFWLPETSPALPSSSSLLQLKGRHTGLFLSRPGGSSQKERCTVPLFLAAAAAGGNAKLRGLLRNVQHPRIGTRLDRSDSLPAEMENQGVQEQRLRISPPPQYSLAQDAESSEGPFKDSRGTPETG